MTPLEVAAACRQDAEAIRNRSDEAPSLAVLIYRLHQAADTIEQLQATLDAAVTGEWTTGPVPPKSTGYYVARVIAEPSSHDHAQEGK